MFRVGGSLAVAGERDRSGRTESDAVRDLPLPLVERERGTGVLMALVKLSRKFSCWYRLLRRWFNYLQDFGC